MRDLAALVEERERALTTFVEVEKGRIALACHALARAFARGGTLHAFGVGAAATDAAHVAVEFMHPVIVGKRALAALAPPNPLTALTRPGDVALTIAHGGEEPEVRAFRERARRDGLLTVAFTGEAAVEADFSFAVPSADPKVVQEVQETAYHVLWELVHVFFEHPGLLDDTLRVQFGRAEAGSEPCAANPRNADESPPECITCGDVAVEAEVVALRNGTATIERDGLREEVAVELLDGVQVGDTVLCHAGVALERIG